MLQGDPSDSALAARFLYRLAPCHVHKAATGSVLRVKQRGVLLPGGCGRWRIRLGLWTRDGDGSYGPFDGTLSACSIGRVLVSSDLILFLRSVSGWTSLSLERCRFGSLLRSCDQPGQPLATGVDGLDYGWKLHPQCLVSLCHRRTECQGK